MEEKIYNSLPALQFDGIYPLPNNDFRYEFIDDKLPIKMIIEQATNNFGGNIILVFNKPDGSFYDVGVLCNIIVNVKSNNILKLRFKILNRVNIVKTYVLSNILVCEYDILNTIYDDEKDLLINFNMLKKNFFKTPKQAFQNYDLVYNLMQDDSNIEKSVDCLAHNLNSISQKDKLKYLLEDNLLKRIKYALEDLIFISYAIDLEDKINDDVRKNIEQSQKEFYLREKMRAIQNELGDKAKREEEIDELRTKLNNLDMPKDILNKALNELKRYEQMNPNNVETNIIKHYLDFITELPWNKYSKDIDDLNYASKILDQNHYGLDKVKKRIIEYLGVKIMTKKNPKTILCLYGPPGVGKTSLAFSIADALGRKFVRQSLGGMKDEAEIKGHRRTYVGALPGRILNGIKNAGSNNPVFLLDEIDKMASSYKGDPASAMLEVLDPDQNSTFSDYFLEEPYDLSQVLFITTANYIENIPAPLRDRMEMIELSSYTEQEKLEIAKNHILRKSLEEYGLDKDKFMITDDAIMLIIQEYTRESGVRELKRVIGSLIRKAIMEILMNKIDLIKIDSDNLHDYLGKPIFMHNIQEKTNQIGVVTGLAYTQFGGDTLEIEVTHYKGKGNLVLTGKLGDVMKESAMASLSYVKANAKKYNINENIFDNMDIHIHVPEGAVPKDGPSAGVTITTAIVSSLTNRYVKSTLGMTGEMTLRGVVLPIGGLKEKSIAAKRSGLKTILIPYDNIKDLEDIPNEVKESLEIIPVKTLDEVINKALI